MNGNNQTRVERWGLFEITLQGPHYGNPYTDVRLTAEFIHDDHLVEIQGFYDGDGKYLIRFMPESLGDWQYITHSNRAALDAVIGYFTCVATTAANHGPVHVEKQFHFAYADGTAFVPIGTTCYAWIHQDAILMQKTLETLAQAPFNKLRMCIFPKHYAYNQNEPELLPYQKGQSGKFDFFIFNPAFFRHLEQQIDQLRSLGIEADLILFHPYDEGHWGFDSMGRAADEHYLGYLIARLAAYRNVWWSLANEYDAVKTKTSDDWDYLFQVVERQDPYKHLRSIHNMHDHYDHRKSWVTHASVQNRMEKRDLEDVPTWRELYQKPVILDETRYEGNIPYRWGHITAQEMVRRFWVGTLLGGYVGHGETYLHPDDILWWSKGGVLHGESPARIAFLKQILQTLPATGLTLTTALTRQIMVAEAGEDQAYFLAYTNDGQPAEVQLSLPPQHDYHIEIMDTWDMTIMAISRTFHGECKIRLPAKPYIALRIRKAVSG